MTINKYQKYFFSEETTDSFTHMENSIHKATHKAQVAIKYLSVMYYRSYHYISQKEFITRNNLFYF